MLIISGFFSSCCRFPICTRNAAHMLSAVYAINTKDTSCRTIARYLIYNYRGKKSVRMSCVTVSCPSKGKIVQLCGLSRKNTANLLSFQVLRLSHAYLSAFDE